MPSLRQIAFLFACCITLPLAAQESRRFVIPSDQAQVSFGPQTPPTPQEQLRHIADSLGTQPPQQIRPASIQPVVHSDYREPPTIVSASMGRNDAGGIQAAVLPPAAPQRLESMLTDEDEDEDEEIVPKKQSVLDAPLVHSGSPDAQGRVSKPLISGGIGPIVSMFASLFLVITTFLILALLFKKVSPKGARLLPKELFENLGRAPLTQKLQLHLLRLGNRLILVSVTLDGVQPITEITDPDEVVQLLGLCRRLDSNSSTQNFKKMFSTLAAEPTEGGYFGADVEPRTKSRTKATSKSSLVDLYSESNESLTELLANGLKGGRNG